MTQRSLNRTGKLASTLAGTFVLAALAGMSTPALAGPSCTEGRTAEWIDENVMQQRIVDMGYKIKKFKESRGHCYEIYGWNSAGQKVEVYFHPVSGKIMKEEIED
ncbi:PepSY domain-containing protein [Oceanospirillum sediminis]|uniref:PepSY domain-containing protein n=1 Tax=Oceanospirillum sediminis TaxID=2760088 RepID=A0A839IUI1_9GAMM|nr:PepSY domain-containing protein [Oceanospirillum sediminis]MBB1488608.1 PepSY domain-containing protein [Oceanospirillum sediminis]